MAKVHVGTCQQCGVAVYYDKDAPTSEESNVGDYDCVCYPCQFEMMDKGTWRAWKEEHV